MGDERQDDVAALVRRLRAREPAAFGELYSRYADRLYGLCRRMVGDDALAEDLLQETFERVFQGLRDLREDAAFSTWVFQIAVNACRNARRARVRRRELPLADDAPICAPEPPRSDTELRSRIEQALEALDDDQCAVLLLRAVEGFSYSRIAEVTGETENQVRGRLHRARRAFVQAFRAP